MSAPPRIFVGYEDCAAEAYEVLRYSLRKHSSSALDIRPLVLRELDFRRPADPLASTEFTYTRFLVPWLCGFEGLALYLDSDMLCLGDIMELFAPGMQGAWLKVVQHDHRPASSFKMGGKPQTRYPRKNWSSLMLMDCSRLTAWTKAAVETESAAWLHRFAPIPDERIAALPPRWNSLDRLEPDTRLIHYTEGGPWLEACKDHPHGGIWREYLDGLRRGPAA